MSYYKFAKGQAYVGTATVSRPGRRIQKIFIVADRKGDCVSFAHVKNVKRELVDDFDGSEIAKVRDEDGLDYFMSARVPVDIDESFHVVGLCQA